MAARLLEKKAAHLSGRTFIIGTGGDTPYHCRKLDPY